ncbi:MAG: glycosyltransferase family 9 protein [Candidatus Rokubacteria bacterium]|nr:glycosyltransferase family 9 protein [Candidatus Rokubacteria bacterium]
MSEKVIVRLPNWLGDTVMAVPAIRSLRAALPEAEVLLAGPWAALLENQGCADVLVTYPRSWGGRLRTADTVRNFAGEIALLLPNSFESALAALYWRARRRLGFAGSGRAWLLTEAPPLPAPRLHQVDEYLLLVGRLGVTAVAREPRLDPPAPGAPERQAARDLLREAGAATRSPGRPLVGIHLGATYGPAKVWPADRVAEFCRAVGDDGGVPVLLGPPEEGALVREIVAVAPAVSLVGRDRPALLPALLAEIDVLVAGDTGVSHLAAAMGTRVVALFGPTDPALTAPRGRALVLGHAVPCAPCFYRTCPIDHPCMRGIEPREVRARMWALLAEPVAR